MKKLLTLLMITTLFVSCRGELKYRGNYDNLIVVSVKRIDFPKTVHTDCTRTCKYKVRNYNSIEGTYTMTWTFVDELGKFEVGDTIKFVKK